MMTINEKSANHGRKDALLKVPRISHVKIASKWLSVPVG